MIAMEKTPNGKLPQWLEDLTLNSPRPRPQSWKPPLSDSWNITRETRRAITTPGRLDLSPVKRAFLGLQLDNDDNDVITRVNSRREGSARFGRRANNKSATVTPRNKKDSPSANTGDETTDSSQDDTLLYSLLSPVAQNNKSSTSLQSPMTTLSRRHSLRLDLSPNEKSLEESWNSLSFFNRKHRGRLSRKLDVPATVSTELLSPQILSPDPVSSSKTDVAATVANLTNNAVPPTDNDFIIPELPKGRDFELDIVSTWGDRHYVGLNGIEIFTTSGELIQVNQISADPADINILPEYNKDPRVVKNLLDRVNRTRDDMHLWLTPFTEGKHHYIRIKFKQIETIAMIRIWNYNKSRIHSYRGVKDVNILLDGMLIFQGEIARACGGIIGSTDAFGDTILFTTDEDILEKVSLHDDSFGSVMNEVNNKTFLPKQPERPLTADTGEIRPMTCAGQRENKLNNENLETTGAVLCVDNLTINVINNWGHKTMIGLTGIQVLGETGEPVLVNRVSCNDSQSNKNVNRLLDGENETTDPEQMWCTQLKKSQLRLSIYFSGPVHISSIVIWNYNASPELSYCGVKQITMSIDGRELNNDYMLLSPTSADTHGNSSGSGILVRRAPGHLHYSIKQLIPFVSNNSDAVSTQSCSRIISPRGDGQNDEYEPPELPRGFVFQFQLLSTWGDEYYVGLNGIQIFDAHGASIHLMSRNISAYPSNVNLLDGIENDVRTVEKLIDGINDTSDGRHMWLAPILPGELNRVYIVFDKEVTVSMIKLWNYGKTPTRGVKEFGILVDDLLVYNGVLDTVGINISRTNKQVPYRTVLFSNDRELARRERGTQVACSHFGRELDLVASLDNSRATSGGSMISADQSQRPFTSLRNNLSTASCMSVPYPNEEALRS